MITRNVTYTLEDVLSAQNPLFATDPLQHAFDDQIQTTTLASGDFGSQVTVQDGHLKSSNYDGSSGTGGTTGWYLGAENVDLPTVEAQELHIPDEVTANSFHVETDGDTWWGATTADFNSNNDNATAYVLKTGVAKFQNVTLDGTVVVGALSSGSLPSIQGWQYSGAFSASDHNTVAWASGTLTFSNGETRSITGSNTGNMSARTYIYYDEDTSTTAFQTTTTAATAVGGNKILIAVAQNTTSGKDAEYQVYGGTGGFSRLWDTEHIAANAITANEISANTITANEIAANTITASQIAANAITTSELSANSVTATKINVSQLSAISANLGTITAGSITINSGVASINSSGDATFKSIQVGGSTRQYTVSDNGIFTFGDGSDGAHTTSGNETLTSDKYYTSLTVSSGDTLNPAGYRIFVQDTLTVDGSIARNGTNGSNGSNATSPGATGGAGGGGGAALADGYLKGSPAGAAGGAGGDAPTSGNDPGDAGSAGTATTNSIGTTGATGSTGGAGGAGTSGSGGSGGAGGAGGTATAANAKLIANWHLATLLDVSSSGSTTKYQNSGSSGGGGGGGSGRSGGSGQEGGGGGGGGGSASGGGIIALYARSITVSASGSISADGGTGGTGGNGATPNNGSDDAGGGGGGAGGQGGSGGQIILVYNTYTNNGSVHADGGDGGNGGSGGAASGGAGSQPGSAGTAGDPGSNGTVHQFQVSL